VRIIRAQLANRNNCFFRLPDGGLLLAGGQPQDIARQGNVYCALTSLRGPSSCSIGFSEFKSRKSKKANRPFAIAHGFFRMPPAGIFKTELMGRKKAGSGERRNWGKTAA
jgi:hypothetical protein